MPYKFIENVTLADVAYEATGKNLNELFESAALAVSRTMVKDLKTIASKVTKKVSLENENLEQLLNDFLNEIVFYKDAEKLIFGKYKVSISESHGRYRLKAEFSGEKLDMKKHELIVDVKAATWHMFKVEKTKKGWRAFVVLDV